MTQTAKSSKKSDKNWIAEDFYPENKYAFLGKTAGNMSLLAPRDGVTALHNRKNASEYLDTQKDTPIAILKQTHSTEVITVTEETTLPLSDDLVGDALVTQTKGIILGVLTADCAPILFQAKGQDGAPIIAATHAGWKGALNGILQNTLLTMISIGADLKTLKVAIGPCISQKSYEVSEDFIAPFLNDDPMNIQFFKQSETAEDKLHFDLKSFCANKLVQCDIQADHIFVCPHDTCEKDTQYFSHRRATYQNKANTEGRQLSIITI